MMAEWVGDIQLSAVADKIKKYDSIAEAMSDGMVNRPYESHVSYAKVMALAPPTSPICFYCGRRVSGEFCKGCGASK